MKRLARALLASSLLWLMASGAALAQIGTQSACLSILIPTPFASANFNTWGTTLNQDLTAIDTAIAASQSLSVAGSLNVSLTSNPSGAADQSRYPVNVFTGLLTGNITVFFPQSLCRVFSVTNSTTGAFTLTVAVNNGSGSPAGTTITVPQGQSLMLASDGTNVTQRLLGVLADLPTIAWQTNDLIRWNGTNLVRFGTANNGVLATGATGIPAWLAALANAVLCTNGSSLPAFCSTIPSAVQDNTTRTGTLVSGATGAGFTLNFTASTLSGLIPPVNGGLGAASLAAHGVVVAEGASPAVSITDGGVAGRCLLSGGGADPSYASCPTSASGATTTLYTTAGIKSYPIPGGANVLSVIICGGGGGGGGGGNANPGGQAGGGGSCNTSIYRATDLSSPVAVTIGSGGTGGAATSDGGAGSDTTFGTYLTAYAGGGGKGNSTSSGGGGGGGLLGDGGTGTGSPGSAGRMGGGVANAGTGLGGDATVSFAGGSGGITIGGAGSTGGESNGCAGGGGGGSVNAGSPQSGGSGGSTPNGSGGSAGSSHGGAPGGNGGAGTPIVSGWFGPGGGGGGANTGGFTAGAGGAGANCGGGGGGGGAHVGDGGTGGAGGNGGAGWSLITAW